ncbi:hypothetical protein OH76DRAFT_1422418 [Lentinus brumalis]|uniref:Uncharacterized protein n=1 Tax=Lentinus brumalis TaxID=2498619 RepID=A0A371CQR0_9APHY|nr:hypothetical protein OH76DRAFT_1422418 [Polyporus brumalis]
MSSGLPTTIHAGSGEAKYEGAGTPQVSEWQRTDAVDSGALPPPNVLAAADVSQTSQDIAVSTMNYDSVHRLCTLMYSSLDSSTTHRMQLLEMRINSLEFMSNMQASELATLCVMDAEHRQERETLQTALAHARDELNHNWALPIIREAENNALRAQVRQQEESLQELKSRLNDYDSKAKQAEGKMVALERDLKKKDIQLRTSERTLAHTLDRLRSRDEHIQQQDNAVRALEQRLQQEAQQADRELAQSKSSHEATKEAHRKSKDELL